MISFVYFHVFQINNVGFNCLILTDSSEMLNTIENGRFKPQYHCSIIPYFEPEVKKAERLIQYAKS